jgi:uncharacterized protein (TIGR04222 family)
MNPFDLNGPNFLVFYAICGAVVCLILYLLRLQEPQTPDGAVPTDPQAIAYLRGGATEALRITAVTLLERGALVLGPNDTLGSDPHHTLPRDASAIDRLVYEHFRTEGPARSLFKNESLALRVEAHARRPLEDAGLMPDETLRKARWGRLLAAVAALGGLAAVKIALALQRGHSNVGFLLIEAAVFGLIACRLTIRHRTPAGDRALDYLKHTFDAVRQRTKPLKHPDPLDVALVAAVFGLAALPEAPYANAESLRPRQDSSGWIGDGGWSGGGDSGGGGGGGGGCGGGCGGCGGG